MHPGIKRARCHPKALSKLLWMSTDLPEDSLAWNLAGLPGAISEASYFTAANATQFRLIVSVLFDEQAHRLTGVAEAELPELIRARLETELDAARADALLTDPNFTLENRLQQLVRWGTVEVWQDEARTDEDFLRKRERYQLTERGAALHRLLQTLESDRDSTGGAALLAPPIINDRLEATLDALRRGDVDAASLAFTQVQTTVHDMAAAAGRWQSRLAAGLGGAPTEEKVTRLRQTVLDYIEVWGAGVDLYSEPIVSATERLLDEPDQRWRAMALHRRGTGVPEDEIAREAAGIVDTLQVMLTWFAPAGQAGRLRRQVRDAVAPLLRGHRTLLAVGGAISRRATLLDVAARLDAADDDAAWQIWSRATGLFGARHLALAAPEAEPHTSAWQAPPVHVENRLRVSGPRALTGTAALLPDTARHRAAARTRALAERARLAEAEAALAERSGTTLSSWGPLEADQADLLLDLLAVAWARLVPAGQPREAVSRDGRWTARFHPVEPRASAVLQLPDGRLVVEDAVMELVR